MTNGQGEPQLQNPPGVNIHPPQQAQQQGTAPSQPGHQQTDPPTQNTPPPQHTQQGQYAAPPQQAQQGVGDQLTGVLSDLATNVAALPERVVDAFREGVNVGQAQTQQAQSSNGQTGQGQVGTGGGQAQQGQAQDGGQSQGQQAQQQAGQTPPGQQEPSGAKTTRGRFQDWWFGTQ